MTSKEITLTADLHSHSFHSDGKQSPQVMLDRAKELGLDIWALTDHNTVAGIIELQRQIADTLDESIQLISGFELSLITGHYLVLGIDPEIIQQQINRWDMAPGSVAHPCTSEEERDYLWWAVDQGGYIIAAHPFVGFGLMNIDKKRLTQYVSQGLVHAAEIHNHDLERKTSIAGKAWHRKAKKRVKKLGIPAFANSDAHHKNHLGKYYNLITVPSDQDFLEALRQGTATVSPVGTSIKDAD